MVGLLITLGTLDVPTQEDIEEPAELLMFSSLPAKITDIKGFGKISKLGKHRIEAKLAAMAGGEAVCPPTPTIETHDSPDPKHALAGLLAVPTRLDGEKVQLQKANEALMYGRPHELLRLNAHP